MTINKFLMNKGVKSNAEKITILQMVQWVDEWQNQERLTISFAKLSLPTTKELRIAREFYELQVKSNSMLNKPISGHWQEGVEWILSKLNQTNDHS